MEVSDQLHASASLPPVPLGRRMGGPQTLSGLVDYYCYYYYYFCLLLSLYDDDDDDYYYY
jgi:hypothetical protein